MDSGIASGSDEGCLSRMALNDNKAGMEGLDRDKINKIIMESSKGSRFYENELKKDRQVNQRIERMMQQKAQITEQQLRKAQTQVDKLAFELERSRDLSRVIVHVDMDAFYAAVEMRDCPELKDKPMAVGSMSMLSTSNYHARKFGVRAAMPGFIAKKLCPALVIVPPNFEKYRAISDEIQEIFADYDPNFQPLSLDEAYLDFTDHLEQRRSWPESLRTHHLYTNSSGAGEAQTELPQGTTREAEDLSPVLFEDSPSSSPWLLGSKGSDVAGGLEVFGTSAEEAVREMRFRIEQKTMLTASAGIAPNMRLAKVCSDKNKPNGQYRLPSDREAVMDFTQNLPVRKVSGIGKVSEKMLSALGICSCAHLGQEMALLSLLVSETAWHHFMHISLGLGATHIERDGERKSMSTERTFRELSAVEEQLSLCRQLCEDLAKDMKKEGLKGKTITLKLKNVNFEVKNRGSTLPCAVATVEEIFAVAKELLKTEIENVSPQLLRLRLMGVRISNFVSSDDKKPLQKSIVSFLQQGRTEGSGGLSHGFPQKSGKEDPIYLSTQSQSSSCFPLAQPQHQKNRQDGVPWFARQMELEVDRIGEQQQQSFFRRAHAQRLQLQTLNTYIKEENHKNCSSGIMAFGTHTQNSKESPTHCQQSNVLVSSRTSAVPHTTDVTVFPIESNASTSGWVTTVSESLVCPVCFREVETTDLNIFNQHIDQCLSCACIKPNQDTDSDSDLELEQVQNKRDKMDPKGERENQNKGSHVIEMSEQLHRMPYSNLSTEKNTNINLCDTSDPSPDHHNLKNYEVHSFPRVSLTHKGSTGGVSLKQPEMCHDHKESALICPVCQVTQDTNDLTIFNHHVDLCLNQQVLLELEGQPSTTGQPSVTVRKSKVREGDQLLLRPVNKGKSKRQNSPSSPPSKRAKGLGQLVTIDKFFR
ncbi:DNA polymerase kappa [Lampris incognitus]|uniref:DNA polymerase kappa n=1 Tax=Lampris incognitus TaxID=2546036 RepID=UPI0024B57C3F|nr:DNA polymerase kappa [Lampris incognitus]